MKNKQLIAFGAHLRSLREVKGLTQVQLAEKGNFDRNYIGMLERGERNPTLINLIRLARALDMQLSQLLNLEFKND